MAAILVELDQEDPEHPDTWLIHDSGWSLCAFETGRVVWENADADQPPRHMRDVARATVLALWQKLASGAIDEIEREPWCDGRGADAAPALWDDERHAALRELDRQFYDLLGPERTDARCQAPRCERGAVRASVFCRVHHFENVRGRASPFDH
jgi:hypothetical protein